MARSELTVKSSQRVRAEFWIGGGTRPFTIKCHRSLQEQQHLPAFTLGRVSLMAFCVTEDCRAERKEVRCGVGHLRLAVGWSVRVEASFLALPPLLLPKLSFDNQRSRDSIKSTGASQTPYSGHLLDDLAISHVARCLRRSSKRCASSRIC